jgi:UDP-N-acetylglucosamine/UDP-N-acetyl-alpha-D-glucosaminouronate 4-epimerase
MRALVTGGAGFIGHHLVRALVERGDQVAVLDDLSTGQMSRLDSVIDRITVIEGSILEPAALARAIDGVEVVFHEAALASVARSIADPRRTNEINVAGTIDVMGAAARHGARRVVFASSSAVYGTAPRLPSTEEQLPAPTSPYGVSKLAGEHDVHVLGRLTGVETVALRYFNVYGPGQDPASEYAAVIPRFITAVLGGVRPTINGSGEISRDFVHVDDAVAANLLAARPTSPSGLTCNVATGSGTTLLQLLDAVCLAAGREVEPTYGPPRDGDIFESRGDTTTARRALGYDAAVTLREGIARTVAWYRGMPQA